MEFLVVSTILLLPVATLSAETLPVCSINVEQLSERAPLLLHSGGPLNVSGFAAPDADHVVRLSANASLLLACPGPGNQLLFAKRTSGYRQVSATCAREGVVTVRGEPVDLRSVECAGHVERTAEKDTSRRCGDGARGQRMRIGFRLLTGFLELVTVCFDDQLLSPIYSNYTLVQGKARTWSRRSRLGFRAGRLFGSVDPAHQYETQRKTLERHQQLLDSDPLVSEPLTLDAGPVWAPGVATVFYETAAPQWRSVNVGAWAWVERAARSLAEARGDLLVVTGVCGLTSLPDAQGNRSPLFLFAQGAQRKMPVPALYWKVLYDPHTREGAAVVGSNNPWESLVTHPELRLCADVCARLHWLPAPMPREVYCCEVDALRLSVRDMPPLEVEGLLVGPGAETERPSTVAAPTSDPPTTGATSTESSSMDLSSTETHLSSSPPPETAQHPTDKSRSAALQFSTFLLLCTLSVHAAQKTMSMLYNEF